MQRLIDHPCHHRSHKLIANLSCISYINTFLCKYMSSIFFRCSHTAVQCCFPIDWRASLVIFIMFWLSKVVLPKVLSLIHIYYYNRADGGDNGTINNDTDTRQETLTNQTTSMQRDRTSEVTPLLNWMWQWKLETAHHWTSLMGKRNEKHKTLMTKQ